MNVSLVHNFWVLSLPLSQDGSRSAILLCSIGSLPEFCPLCSSNLLFCLSWLMLAASVWLTGSNKTEPWRLNRLKVSALCFTHWSILLWLFFRRKFPVNIPHAYKSIQVFYENRGIQELPGFGTQASPIVLFQPDFLVQTTDGAV